MDIKAYCRMSGDILDGAFYEINNRKLVVILAKQVYHRCFKVSQIFQKDHNEYNECESS